MYFQCNSLIKMHGLLKNRFNLQIEAGSVRSIYLHIAFILVLFKGIRASLPRTSILTSHSI